MRPVARPLRRRPLTRLGRLAAASVAAVLTVLVAAPLRADESSFLFPRFSLTGGSFFETTETKVRVDADVTGIPGDLVDFESELGLDDSEAVLRFGLDWRPLARHQFSLGYHSLSRDGTETLTRDIQFGDTLFPISADVTGSFDLEFLEFAYTLWAMRRETAGLGVSIGATAISAEAGLVVESDLGGGVLREEADTDLPVGMVGAELRLAPARRLLLAATVRALPSVQIEDVDGSALSYGARAEVQIVRNVGLGLAWNSFELDLEVEDGDDLTGTLDFTSEGGEVYLRLLF